MKISEAAFGKVKISSMTVRLLTIAAAAVITLIFLNSMSADRDGRSTVISPEGSNQYTESVITEEEIRLKNILECISGVGKVQVMISGSSNSEPVSVFSSENREEKSDETCGVIVAAEGGGDPFIQSRITDAVSTVCGIKPSDVIVFELRQSSGE